MRSLLTAAATLILWVCLAAAAAAQNCITERPVGPDILNSTPVTGTFCVASVPGLSSEHAALWTVTDDDAQTLWTVRLEPLPGVLARLTIESVITDAGGASTAPYASIDNWSSQGDIVLDDLLFSPGRYLVRVDTQGLGLFRLFANPQNLLPPAQSEPTQVDDDFEVLLTGNGQELRIPWSLSADASSLNWTVSTTTPGVAGNLIVASVDAGNMATAYSRQGTALLADLGLAPGSYEIVVSGLPAATPVLVRAVAAGTRGAGVESEPNDSTTAPVPLPPEAAVVGRLIGANASYDVDHYLLAIPPDWQSEVFDVVLETPAQTKLALLDQSGRVLQERAGTTHVELPDLVLEPGSYHLSVTGTLATDEHYSLALRRQGPHDHTREAEPNDDLTVAYPMTSSMSVSGTLRGDERDVFRFVVEGEPSLWRVVAEGAGLTRVINVDRASSLRSTDVWPTDGKAELSSLLMLPGEHFVEVHGSGDYDLRIEPQGPFDPARDEVEPNDQEQIAQTILLGSPRKGRIGWDRDQDAYRLHLPGVTRIKISLEGPDGQDTSVALRSEGDGRNLTLLVAPDGDQRVWQGELEGGNYILAVGGSASSKQGYRLAVNKIPWSETPPDLEPNDSLAEASALPASFEISGHLHPGDVDHYLIPAVQPGTFTLTSQSPALADSQLTIVRLDDASGPVIAPIPAEVIYVAQSEPGVWAADLPTLASYVLTIAGGDGHYAAAVSPPGQDPGLTPSIEIALQLDALIVGANLDQSQRVSGRLMLSNTSNETTELDLAVLLGDERWDASLGMNEVAVLPDETVEIPLQIKVAPEADPSREIAVVATATASNRSVTIAEAAIKSRDGAVPVSPFEALPLPEELLGGLNVAAAAMGASVSDGHNGLIDGLTGPGGLFSVILDGAGGPMPVVDLMGDKAVPLAGVILDTTNYGSARQRLRHFAISLSEDGDNFRQVFEGRASPRAGEQGFVFDEPQSARFVRLEPLSSQNGPGISNVEIAELKVIAGKAIDDPELNLLRPELGGHVVWISPGVYDPQAVLTPEIERPYVATDAERTEPIEWVVGFANNRAARVERMEWTDAVDSDPAQQVRSVTISYSLDSPRGPWKPIGSFELQRRPDGSLAPVVFHEPVWTRYVRFSVAPPFASWTILPETLSLMEAPDLTMGSSLGEWGGGRRDGPFERLFPATAPAFIGATADAPDQRDEAQLLMPDLLVNDSVQLGVDEDWFLVEVPEDLPRLRLDLSGGNEVELEMLDEAGQPVELRPSRLSEDKTSFHADLAPGPYFVRVQEPERSIVIAWDTSGSVLSYLPQIVQSVISLVASVDPQRESVLLIPFRGDPSPPLIETWSEDPLAVLEALQNYPWTDSSSNAEAAVLSAATELSKRRGARAIVVITDAESDGALLSGELWAALDATRPRVFVLGVPSGSTGAEALKSRALMHDLANTSDGWVTMLTSPSVADQAFSRLARQLRREKPYGLKATLAPRPVPGALVVRSPDRDDVSRQAEPLVGDHAVEIILDASGSMLQRLQGRRRIEIAKDILADLVGDSLPSGIPFALRVFGQGQPDSCDTELVLPPAGLDPSSVRAAVESVSPTNRAKTPIAASLRAVAEDLASVTGRRLVVLLTDGEETCDGEVAGEIAALRDSGIDLRINIVGFALDDDALKEQFADWAVLGGGQFYDANDVASLGTAMKAALMPQFEVRDPTGEVVGLGTVDGPQISIEPGDYEVTVLSHPPRLFRISVEPGAFVELDPRD